MQLGPFKTRRFNPDLLWTDRSKTGDIQTAGRVCKIRSREHSVNLFGYERAYLQCRKDSSGRVTTSRWSEHTCVGSNTHLGLSQRRQGIMKRLHRDWLAQLSIWERKNRKYAFLWKPAKSSNIDENREQFSSQHNYHETVPWKVYNFNKFGSKAQTQLHLHLWAWTRAYGLLK